jgi:choline dehydrogenase
MGYGKGYSVRCVVVRGPHSPGTVRITSADPTATPAIDPQMFQNPDERRSLDEAVAWAQVPTHPESGLRSDMSLNPHGVAHPFDELRVTPVSPDRLIAEKTLRNLYDGPNVSVDGCQLGGTCCIGKAVDERLQVRGVRGVWVADASIVPKRVQADMGLLAQMIGTKAGSELVGAESP